MIVVGCATSAALVGRSPVPVTQEVDLGHLFEGIPSDDASFVLLSADGGTITRYNPARARKRFVPASTYKIPNTLIALETGVAPDADFELAWDENLRPDTGFWAKSWSQDHTLRSALRHSVYWYYQELARRIGSQRMQLYLDRFEYGNRSMGGGLDQFWLHGDLRISPDEQVEFLRRLFAGELGVSERSIEILRDLLVLESNSEYRLSGKTGTVNITPSRELAWLVGYIERDQSLLFFALNVEGEEVWERWGPPEKRLELVRTILRSLSVLPAAEIRASDRHGGEAVRSAGVGLEALTGRF
ncbi:MAG: class D beta-lactamase [bacterium]|nr:class D beta-lactamase [bacterium]